VEGLIAGSHDTSDRLLCRRVLADGTRPGARITMVAVVPTFGLEMWS
jgi:hypothetical protein